MRRVGGWSPIPAMLLLVCASDGHAQQAGEHVPPDPPQHQMPDMSYRSMTQAMGMDDTAAFGKLLLDQFEWRDTRRGGALVWDATADYGTDYNKILLRTEGERIGGRTEDARAELSWDHVTGRWWSAQLGIRHDFGPGPSRDWLAVGVQGLAPYGVDIEAMAYAGDAGRTAARLKSEYEWLFTQRLMLQLEVELNVYGKSDPGKGVRSGLSDVQAGFRLRYEIRREMAPYIGVAWVHHRTGLVDGTSTSTPDTNEIQAVAGLRIRY